MAAATDTLYESANPCMGRLTSPSHPRRSSSDGPIASLPNARHTLDALSRSRWCSTDPGGSRPTGISGTACGRTSSRNVWNPSSRATARASSALACSVTVSHRESHDPSTPAADAFANFESPAGFARPCSFEYAIRLRMSPRGPCFSYRFCSFSRSRSACSNPSGVSGSRNVGL